MTPAVLDATALLALLNDEPGAERVAGYVSEAAIGAVNLTEVIERAVHWVAKTAADTVKRVAQELVHRAVVDVDDVGHDLEVLVEELVDDAGGGAELPRDARLAVFISGTGGLILRRLFIIK